MCITSGPLVLSMRFGRDFLQKLSDFDSRRGPFGCPFGTLLAYFWAGGRGGVLVASESAESDLRV